MKIKVWPTKTKVEAAYLITRLHGETTNNFNVTFQHVNLKFL